MTKCAACGSENPADSAFCENCGKPLTGSGPAPNLQTISDLQTIEHVPTLPRRDYPKDESLTLEPGATVGGRYAIEALIGIGGMGVVYRARDQIGNRLVALKLIRSDRLGGKDGIERLISEGVLTQDIRHKNIVAVYDVDKHEGQPFVAMEFVNGVSLRDWLRKQTNARVDVPMKVAARIINEVLDGLQVAHDMGVIHRDLKPENIMLIQDPREDAAPLKLLDFGIARTGSTPTDSGATGLGTPRYMAPEQITNPDNAGPSADLYSLSTIFYELLVGVLPQGGWQPPSSGRADVPAGIDALIQSGLQNRPGSRPQSVAEYREKLNAALGGRPVVPPDDDHDVVVPKPKGKWVKIGAGALGGIALLAAIGNFIPENEIDPPPPPPPSRYASLTGQWLDDQGGGLNISVAEDGSFSGSGATGDGMNMTIQGGFSGTAGRYTVSNGAMSLPGQLTWDGRDCHLMFSTTMPDGSVAMQGRFHVNHQPGAPCPA